MTTDTITSVKSVALAVPLSIPVRWATREVSAREHVLVFIEDSSGRTGIGLTYAGVNVSRSMARFIDDVLAPRIVGLPVDAPERPWADLYQETILVGRRGFAIRAISAVDIGLWDLFAKSVAQPIYTILGGIRDRVPAYASGGYYRPGDPLKNVERELGRYVELGFHDFKIKVGGLPMPEDVERVRVAREVIGAGARLALDANNAWKLPSDAIRFVRAVERYDPWWIEEPLPPDDTAGHAEIARSVDLPVATGEIHATRWDFKQLIAAQAADIIQPDAAVAGGVSEWMKIVHSAATFDVGVAPHWNADIHVHLAGAAANCLTVEWFDLQQDIINFERLLGERLRPKDGIIPIPQRPGFGLDLDHDAIRRYRVEH